MTEYNSEMDGHTLMTNEEKKEKGYDFKSFALRMDLRLKKIRASKNSVSLFGKTLTNCKSSLS